MVTGVDLVEQQILAAAGEKLSLPDTRPWSFRGHAIECRINAEDPRSFAPWPGPRHRATTRRAGAGSGSTRGCTAVGVSPAPTTRMIAKVIAHAPTRAEAIVKMQSALDEFIIDGIRTNIPLHQALLREPEVLRGEMTTRTIERVVARGF
jgi:acetyl-CoA carboxylase biotin carboxylase subunit